MALQLAFYRDQGKTVLCGRVAATSAVWSCGCDKCCVVVWLQQVLCVVARVAFCSAAHSARLRVLFSLLRHALSSTLFAFNELRLLQRPYSTTDTIVRRVRADLRVGDGEALL
jgi:hypothetical protein